MIEPFQNAYVTRDLDRAVAWFREEHAIDSFKCFEFELPVATPEQKGFASIRVALAWVGALQYELIQPVSGLVEIYRNVLPPDQGLRLHHSCTRVRDWSAFRTQLAARGQTVVLEGGTADQVQFAYVDARETLGHYLEYCWMSPKRWDALRAL